MPIAILATDIIKDPSIKNIAPVLESLGFRHELIYPCEKCLDAARMVSIANGRIDLIIILHTGAISSGTSNPKQIISSLREFPDEYAFQGSVKVKSIPILIIIDRPYVDDFGLHSHHFSWLKIFDLVRSQKELSDEIIDLLGAWRTDLLSELECVGYSIIIDSSGDLSVNPTFKRIEAEGQILVRSTSIEKLRKSKYLILSKDLLVETEPYHEFQYLLNNYRNIAKKEKTKPEEIFQKFFEQYPSFILRDQFQSYWSKPKLKLPDKPGRYYEPDFVLKPKIGESLGTKWEVLDLKLPDAKLTLNTKFHPGFSAGVFKAVQQLYNYRDYFNRPDVNNELKKNFGFVPRNPRLSILIGRDRQHDPDVFINAQGKFKMLDIKFITYDELLESHANQIIIQSEILKSITGIA